MCSCLLLLLFSRLVKVPQLPRLFATPWTISQWNSPDQNTGVGSFSIPQGIFPSQGSNLGFLHCKWILYQLPQGKPKNTGVGRLSLLQWIFLTEESNQGPLHCRRILYQLSYQGSPLVTKPCSTLCNPRDCSTASFPVPHYLPEFAQTHAHWVSDAIQTFHPVTPFFSCSQPFLTSGSFPKSQFFTSGDQMELQLQHQ